MIEEVLNDILEAEKEAEAICAKGEEQALSIMAENITACAEKRRQGSALAKQKRNEIMGFAEQEAQKNYAEITAESTKNAEAILKEKNNLAGKLGEEVFRSILNGNC